MPAGRDAAIDALRREQALARERAGAAPFRSGNDALARAIALAHAREAGASLQGEHYLIEGQRYAAATEQVRWARTREILTRVSPGADEDPRQLEFLARQAASIEVMLRGELVEGGNAAGIALCERVLLGTVPQLLPDAAQRRHGDHFFVLLSAGLIDFVYQLAKATVLSWSMGPREHPQYINFRTDAAEVEAHLDRNSSSVLLLERTLAAFLFNGVPRDVVFPVPPPAEYDAPLKFLTNYNERFIIAHEYAHVFHEAHDIVPAGDAHANEEFASDVIALRLVIDSGAALDAMPTGISTQGAYFVLTALDVLRRALDVARHGEVRGPTGFAGHPPPRARLQVAEACQRQLAPAIEDDVDLAVERGRDAARTLEQLWRRVLKNPSGLQPGGRALHPMWQQA